jgi:hypothetical protein
MPQHFRSRVSIWLVAFLTAAFGAVGVFAGVDMIHSDTRGRVILLIGFTISLVPVLWLLLGTSYTIDGAVLLVRSGPIKYRIPLADITAISAIRTIESAPALSSDRLVIAYGHDKSLMISPRQRAGFLSALAAAGVAAAALPVAATGKW